jgi:hypothetical protein
MSSLGGDGAIKPLADHASDFVPDVFCSRLRLAHRRAVAPENYHLGMPGSTLDGGGSSSAPGKAAQGAERECGRGSAGFSVLKPAKQDGP